MQSIFGLEQKRILVLGGGLGMGEATARLLASLGAHVAVADRELDRAEVVAAKITANGGTAIALDVDVLDDTALVSGIGQAEAAIGPLDGMATVIGMAAWSSLIDMDLATWDEDHRRNADQLGNVKYDQVHSAYLLISNRGSTYPEIAVCHNNSGKNRLREVSSSLIPVRF